MTLPKKLRARFGITPETEVEFVVREGRNQDQYSQEVRHFEKKQG